MVSNTDLAIFHAVPIFFFKDGLSGFHKALAAVRKYPNRFIGAYIAVDPLRPDPIGELNRQFDEMPRTMGLLSLPPSHLGISLGDWGRCRRRRPRRCCP